MSISFQTKYNATVQLPYGQLRPIVEWCDRNCTSEWHYMEDPNADMYTGWVFLFENERDYVAFQLFIK